MRQESFQPHLQRPTNAIIFINTTYEKITDDGDTNATSEVRIARFRECELTIQPLAHPNDAEFRFFQFRARKQTRFRRLTATS